jgi:hypothetical protein
MKPQRRKNSTKLKQKKMLEVSRKMDGLAKKLGKWDPQAIVRNFRDSNLTGKSYRWQSERRGD